MREKTPLLLGVCPRSQSGWFAFGQHGKKNCGLATGHAVISRHLYPQRNQQRQSSCFHYKLNQNMPLRFPS